MNEYVILLNGEFFAEFQSYNTNEEKVLSEFFAVNHCEIEYFDTDEIGKLTACTWQGNYTIQ
jgi:hypothetical protein